MRNNINVIQTRSSDGSKFVATITSKQQDGTILKFKMIGDNRKGIVKVLYFEGGVRLVMFKTHIEYMVTEGPLSNLVNRLVRESSLGTLDPESWVWKQLY